MSAYPVGRCDDPRCLYAEPHRHGLDCDRACVCEGVGAELEPLSDDDLQECDWGHCNRVSVAVRREMDSDRRRLDTYEVWLPVCSWHAGWDDYNFTD